MNYYLAVFLFYFFLGAAAWANGDCYADMSEQMFRDLEIVEYWNQRINERLPVTYNHLLQGGYFNMPSSRMGKEGEIGVGFASVPPYRNYNLRCQLIDRLEVSFNYRIFKGIDDPVLTPLGFGDLSDKGANLKLSLFSPEDSAYQLPGVAIGIEDFIGTRNFTSTYIVLTQVFLPYHLEVSFGYGIHRIRGFFGGITWMPFRKHYLPFLKGLSLVAEYDATPYKNRHIESHPRGRKKKSALNGGIKYRLFDAVDLSLSYVRGKEWAWSVSSFYNFGETTGFLPKTDDALPYTAPIVTEPIGPRRPEDVMVHDLLSAMQEQGFELLEAKLSCDIKDNQILRLRIANYTYYLENEVRGRLNNLLAYLIPSNIDLVIVVLEADGGFPIQEYHYRMEFVRRYGIGLIGPQELQVLSPLCEIKIPPLNSSRVLFSTNRERLNIELYPKTHTLFGSSRGKFKYALGLNVALNGFLPGDIYYSVVLGSIFWSDLGHLHGVDRLNPSQLPNVRTDSVRYFRQRGITVDEAYLQKNWNLSRGWFARLSIGHFEQEYGGVASEFLYYPLHANYAVGVEGAILGKRTVSGIGFTNRIRQYHGFKLMHRCFRCSQYFLDLYYEWRQARLDFKMMAGKFLANDYGTRFEMARYFPSGLKISIWYTLTNGHDKINGRTYHDKGVAFSMPLDIFYTYSDRARWGYGMSAWLRDVGAIAATGQGIYDVIREQRNKCCRY